MMTATAKRFILPFSAAKNAPEVEAAAVFAVAEAQRIKGGGLLSRQPPETTASIAKLGYPLWLFPRNNAALVFDGLGNSIFNLPYAEDVSATTFLESLEANGRPRENYAAFLSKYSSYFGQPPKTKRFPINGLLANADFRSEFGIYRREAAELAVPAALVLPLLEETAIAAQLADWEKLRGNLRANQERLAECLRQIKKFTGQYITEIDYEAAAATEEANAKIKAQEELTNPLIAQQNKEYHKKIKDLSASFDDELESLQKLKAKTERLIDGVEAKIREYEHEAKVQGKKGHEIYERRWKEKTKIAQKECSGLKKELKKIDDNIKTVGKQKSQGVAQLNFEWDAEVKLLRQPLFELEAARNQKIAAFKAQSNRLVLLEKTVVEGLNRSIELGQTINGAFDDLGISDPQLRTPIQVYVPFYAVFYTVDMARRCLCIAPSTVDSVDFSVKLKGAFGFSKTGDLLAPRFKTIADLIARVGPLANQNSALESQLWSLSEKNNLLRNDVFRVDVVSGLAYLRHLGWLSEREQQELSKRLL